MLKLLRQIVAAFEDLGDDRAYPDNGIIVQLLKEDFAAMDLTVRSPTGRALV